MIVSDNAGGAIVAWSDYRNGVDANIYCQHVTPGGAPDPAWPENGLVVCAAAGNQRESAIVSDGSGGAILAWYDLRDGYYSIYAQHVLAGGVVDPSWPVDGRALSLGSPGRGQRSPRIVSDNSGGAIVVSSGNVILAQHILTGGTIDPTWPVDGLTICTTAIDFALTSDGAGGGIVAWSDDRLGTAVMYAQHVLAGGIDPTWPAAGLALSVSANRQHKPAIVPDGASGALVSWVDYRTDVADIYAQHVLASGARDPAWPANGLAVSTAPGQQYTPTLVIDGAGGAIISWADYRDTYNGDIYAQHVLPTGTVDPTWPGNGRPICLAAGEQSNPALATDGAGGAIVTWNDSRCSVNLYAQHVLANGDLNAAWPTDGLAVCISSNDKSAPVTVSDGAGGAIIAWADRHTGTFDIYSAFTAMTTTAPINRPPTANPGGPYAGVTWATIQFDGQQSTDPDGDAIAAYTWNFGDGNSYGSEAHTTHVYNAAGTYSVTLTVADNGCPTLASTGVTVANISAVQPPAPNGVLLATVIGDTPNGGLGGSVAGIADFNGDGYGDYVVGVGGLNNGNGAAYVYLGGSTAHNTPDIILTGDGGRFGWSVSGAGDMNGDGYPDLIVGALTDRAYVFYGGPSPDTLPDLVLTGFTGSYGLSVAGAGDVNGDGYDDVIIGASDRRAYMYFGGPAATGTPALVLSEAYGNFPKSVSGGDVNGDGFSDLIVGANEGYYDTGRIWVYYGGPHPDVLPDLLINGPGGQYEGFGICVDFAGDVNKDGYGDFIVGTETTGRAYMFYGNSQPDTIPDAQLTSSEAGDRFGQSVAGAGDVNSDGYMDVIVGAWLSNVGAYRSGRADVFYGGPSLHSQPDLSLVGDPNTYAEFGRCVSGAGDVNRDGRAELVVGSREDNQQNLSGRAYLFSVELPGPVDPTPVVVAPRIISASEGVPVAFSVSASTPDGGPIASLTAAALPPGATFASMANHTGGVFSWVPDYAQAGTYLVSFKATNTLTGTGVTEITVANVNRAPAGNPGGPYSGVEGLPVSFNGSGSSDPDGDPLEYGWSFGDGETGSGRTVDHTYDLSGTYIVTLAVADNGSPPLSSAASTSAVISSVLNARVFTTNSNKTIRLGSGKPVWCAAIEPLGNDFDLGNVGLGTIRLVYGGNEIPAVLGKTSIKTDSDNNGIAEIGVCFGKDDLRTLFAGLPSGRTTVSVSLDGLLTTGARFTGSTQVDVVGNGSSLTASLSPNPFNPSAVLTFRTEKAGPVRIRLYDTNGRLVRMLLDLSGAPAGYHDVRVDGRSDSGERLASGIYFYRIETADGDLVGRASILK